MVQLQTWSDIDRIIITDEENHSSVCIEIPNTAEIKKRLTNNKADSFIYALWVDDKHRGHGVGTRLLESAEEQARKQGLKTVCLEWERKDSPTWVLDWYLRQGYEEKEFGRDCEFLVKQISD